MDWMQFTLFCFAIGGLFFWNRSESREDMRSVNAILEEHRKETNSLIQAIHNEIKDFHGRLCALEAKSK